MTSYKDTIKRNGIANYDLFSQDTTLLGIYFLGTVSYLSLVFGLT